MRVDIFYTHLSERGKEWLDLIGTLLFLIPACLLIGWLSWPFFHAVVGRSRRCPATPAACSAGR